MKLVETLLLMVYEARVHLKCDLLEPPIQLFKLLVIHVSYVGLFVMGLRCDTACASLKVQQHSN